MDGHPHRITTAPESATDLALELAVGEAVGWRAEAERDRLARELEQAIEVAR